MDDPGGFWGSVGSAVGAIALAIVAFWRFVRSQHESRPAALPDPPRQYDGPERRGEVKELLGAVQDLRTQVAVLEGSVARQSDSQQQIINRLDRRDELDRRAERRDAENFGSLFSAVRSLEEMIAHERGWKRGGVRGDTPPTGYGLADDPTPEPKG